MSILLAFFAFIFGLFPSLLLSNYSGAQSKASDTVRKNDINSIYQKLEEHYNEYGEYPTPAELSTNYEEKLPGLDKEALFDENGIKINDSGSEYTYSPEGCTAIGCLKYELSAELDDGTDYTKISLN